MEHAMGLDAYLVNSICDKDEAARIAIASKVGLLLSAPEVETAELRAAEAVARELVCDALARVRFELSVAVRSAKDLPKDIALTIAHDMDAIAQPFLETTEVFSESEWERLVVTISMSSRAVVARRSSITEGLALALAQLGNSDVVEALVDNPNAPMTAPVCGSIIDRFDSNTPLLDRLALRDDLVSEIAVALIAKVSDAARAKLAHAYNLSMETDQLVDRAVDEALLQVVRETPERLVPALATCLKDDGKLTHSLMLMALRDERTHFFEAALSETARLGIKSVRTILFHRGVRTVFELFERAGLPQSSWDQFWEILSGIRDKMEADRPNGVDLAPLLARKQSSLH